MDTLKTARADMRNSVDWNTMFAYNMADIALTIELGRQLNKFNKKEWSNYCDSMNLSWLSKTELIEIIRSLHFPEDFCASRFVRTLSFNRIGQRRHKWMPFCNRVWKETTHDELVDIMRQHYPNVYRNLVWNRVICK